MKKVIVDLEMNELVTNIYTKTFEVSDELYEKLKTNIKEDEIEGLFRKEDKFLYDTYDDYDTVEQADRMLSNYDDNLGITFYDENGKPLNSVD